MTPVMNLQVIPDEDLLARSKEWRLRALRGDKDARGIAHELECELRRRFPVNYAPQALPSMNMLGNLLAAAPRRRTLW